jgi:putative MATE family efflux protein
MQQDLTSGPITRKLLGMAGFIGVGLVFQTAYFLVDLYFVASQGATAIAGVGLAGNVFFLAMAASQMVAVGGLSLIARSIGAKAFGDAERTYDQALWLSLLLAVVILVLGYGGSRAALSLIAADQATVDAGATYLAGFLPAVAIMFPSGVMVSALRAAGVVRAPMMIQMGTVMLNVVLAPMLVAGWLTGAPLGVFGAGLASSISALAGLIATIILFPRVQTIIKAPVALVRIDPAIWRRIVGIGLPSAGEFLLMFLTAGIVYSVIRHFGSEAQAGYGVGSRVMQAVFLPAMAVAFAVAPVAGQNFGAGRGDRVRRTVRDAAVISSGLMVVLTLLCQLRPEILVHPFAPDAEVVRIASTFLRIISLNFIATGLIFICSGTFQALGDTRPALIASASRLVTFGVPALWLSTQPWARLEHIWFASAASVAIHAVIALLFLRRELGRKLAGLTPPAQPEAAPA